MATLDPINKDSAIVLLHMRDEKGKTQTLFPLFVNFAPLIIPAETPFKSFYGHEWLRTPSETTMESTQNARREKYSLEDYFKFIGKDIYFINSRLEYPGMSKIYKDLYGKGYFFDMIYGVLHPIYHIEMAGPVTPLDMRDPIRPM